MTAEPIDTQPIPVHITGMEASVQLGQPPAPHQAAVRTRFLTETVDDTNPVRPLLPADPDRVCAYLQVTGGDVYLCGSDNDARQATPAGSVLPKANTMPWPVRGQGPLWAAQAAAATTCVIADYRE